MQSEGANESAVELRQVNTIPAALIAEIEESSCAL